MKKLLKPIGYTFLLIFIFRLGVHIPVLGVDPQAIQSIVNSDAFSIFNLFNGGALSNFSIFALGVSPYITASIIIQLLQMDISPTFVDWSKQGEVGRRKLTRATVRFSSGSFKVLVSHSGLTNSRMHNSLLIQRFSSTL